MSQLYLSKTRSLQFWTSSLVVLPVFLQAPWVHYFPLSALLFTFVLLASGFYLVQKTSSKWFRIGSLLVGVSGSWLGGCLFWGWLRIHPILHLPVEAVALPIACIGLNTKWKIGSSFYLSCLLGTAFTDFMMVVTGVIKEWPVVVMAPVENASEALNTIGFNLINIRSLSLLSIAAFLIVLIADQMWKRGNLNTSSGGAWLVASAALTTTLWVDGLFLVTTMIQPKLSGLI